MLATLTIRGFRNLAAVDLVVPPSGLVIVGENGQGKTNLLEAVAFLGLLRSFRGARDADVVQFGQPACHVRATLTPPAAWLSVTVGFDRASKRKVATLDGVEVPRLTSALGALPSVAFSPADVALVAGGPAERRRYLDVMLAMASPAYLAALQRYRGALLRRNAALKAAQREGGRGSHEARVSVWEPAMAEAGAQLVQARRHWVATHEMSYADLCTTIGEGQAASLRYSGTAEDGLAETLAQQRAMEMRRGMTLVGPHRDDLVLQLGGRDLRTFGSAGQQRSAAIALRLLELATLRAARGHAPLLLLDDPFAELDLGRAGRVLALLESAGVDQLLLAVPRTEDVPAAFTRLAMRRMHRGVLA
jgi:DNA replication and repair protein RecF